MSDPIADSAHRRVRLGSILVPLGLFVVILVAYWPALRGDFIWDDDYYVVNNRALRTADGIQDLWLGLFPDPRRYPAPQYYPMTHTSLWLDYRIWGLNPIGYHLTNVILHALGCWTLWVILRRLQVPGATLAAFVFALHPVNVESVAWITERKNVLSGLFYLLSLLVYLRFAGLDGHVTRQRAAEPGGSGTPDASHDYRLELPTEPWKLYLLSLLMFAFAILSKSVTATLPGAILLITYWKRRRIEWRRDVLPLVPFFLLGLAMSLLTGWMERAVVGAVGAEWAFSPAERIVIAGRAVWFYIGKLLFPYPLMFMYPRWSIDPARVLQWLPALGALGLLAGLWAARRRLGDAPLLGALFFGGTILPALGFVNFFPMRYSFVADHFVYLAALGLIVPLCAAGTVLLAQQRWVGVIVAVGLCGGLGWLSFSHARNFDGPERLWQHTIQSNPESWMAHNNLGLLKLQQNRLEEAEALFRRALELRKDHAEAVLNLGRVAEARGNHAEAQRLYEQAVQMNEDYYQRDLRVTGRSLPRRSHGNAMMVLARFHADRGDLSAARALYEKVIAQDANNVAAISDCGEILRRQGEYERALQMQLLAVQRDPTSLAVRNRLGLALADNGRPQDAIRTWLGVLADDPTNPEANNNLGLMLVADGKWSEAAALFERALQARPDFPEARRNLEAARRRATTAAATAPAAGSPEVPGTQPATPPQ
ncbi:MAG: tetratricopeptide repeat protein [Phycisphaerales bacterium]|nr:tetratricopeptide repeat protein [Phycisphaerales bacterium]